MYIYGINNSSNKSLTQKDDLSPCAGEPQTETFQLHRKTTIYEASSSPDKSPSALILNFSALRSIRNKYQFVVFCYIVAWRTQHRMFVLNEVMLSPKNPNKPKAKTMGVASEVGKRLRQMSSELEASLIYRMSTRTDGAMQSDPVLKQKQYWTTDYF